MSITNLSKKVLRQIKPSKLEEKKIKIFVNDLTRVAKAVSGQEIILCGSIGKFTWLSGDHDIDLFMVFPKTTSREDLEKLGLQYGKRIVSELRGREQIKYAEHPYVRGFVKKFIIDIVPCYGIKPGEKIISAVDRSPLHLRYIIDNLKPDAKDEARLLKQYCKGIGVYGSDTKTEGFSGYICELLIIKYKNFENVIKNSKDWSAGKLIDINGVAEEVNFKDQSLIIIDPVDAKRNAAANVSSENFLRFVYRSKEFMKKPGEKYFFSKRERLSSKELTELKQRETLFIAFVLKKTDIIDDILYPQLRRALRRLSNILRHEDFRVIRRTTFADNKRAYLILELDVFLLPIIKKMEGPPVFSKKHVDEFVSKYKKIRVEGTHLVAERKRDFTTATALLRNIQKQSLETLREKGIPENILKEFRSSKLLEDKKFFREIKANKKLSEFLKEKYFGE